MKELGTINAVSHNPHDDNPCKEGWPQWDADLRYADGTCAYRTGLSPDKEKVICEALEQSDRFDIDVRTIFTNDSSPE